MLPNRSCGVEIRLSRRAVELSDLVPSLRYWARDGTAEKVSDTSDVTADVPAHVTGDTLGVTEQLLSALGIGRADRLNQRQNALSHGRRQRWPRSQKLRDFGSEFSVKHGS